MGTDRKITGRNIILLLLIMVIIIGTVIGYTLISESRVINYGYSAAKENAENISVQMELTIDAAISSAELTSNMVSQMMIDSKIDNVEEILSLLLEDTPFDFIGYVDSNGMINTNIGHRYNVEEKEYYKRGIKGETGICINNEPGYFKESLLNVYTPVFYDNDIVGVFVGAIGIKSSISPVLNTRFFGEDIMISILCDKDGNIITSTTNTASGQSVDVYLEEVGIYNKYWELFKKDNATFQFKGTRGISIAYVMTNENIGWRVIQIVPGRAFKGYMRENVGGAYIIVVVVSVLMLSYLIMIIAQARKRQNKIIEDKDRIVRNYQQILIDTASDTYEGIRKVDLDTGESEYMYFENHKVIQSNIGDWTEWLNRQEKYIDKEDYAKMLNFAGIDNLRNMQEGVTYRINYKSLLKNKDGYYNSYTTTASVSDVNGKRTAVLSTLDNTAAFADILEQNRLLSASASIYDAMYVINIKDDTIESVRNVEQIEDLSDRKKDKAKDRITTAMLNVVDEQHIEALLEFIDIDTLDERMRGANTISFEYVRKVKGWCRTRFIAVDYDDTGRLDCVLWIIENIDSEKNASNRLIYLSETDLMTGIKNRGAGENKIKKLISENHEGLFCLLDADKFKSINDNFGHGVGDKVIIEIARCLKETFDKNDVVMRLGGDEFAVFADGVTDIAEAEVKINEFFRKFEDIHIPELEGRPMYISVGAILKNAGDGMDFEKLYHNVDLCTYESKKIVGNVCTFYNEQLFENK